MALVSHLGHAERFYEILLTPQTSSAMAMFGFVYAWYLMAVLLLEIWFVHRTDMIDMAERSTGATRLLYRVLSLFSKDKGERAVAFDHKALKVITIVGIPSAFLLTGTSGSSSARSRRTRGGAACSFRSSSSSPHRVRDRAGRAPLHDHHPLTGGKINMKCVDKAVDFLFYAVIVDFSLEMVDFIHRVYQSEEEIKILSEMVMNKLFASLIIIQVLLGMLVPLLLISLTKIFKKRFSLNEDMRKMVYFISVILIQFGIFATRWNVVIGGQMFSKSFRGSPRTRWNSAGSRGFSTRSFCWPSGGHPFRPPEGPPPWKELKKRERPGRRRRERNPKRVSEKQRRRGTLLRRRFL